MQDPPVEISQPMVEGYMILLQEGLHAAWKLATCGKSKAYDWKQKELMYKGDLFLFKLTRRL